MSDMTADYICRRCGREAMVDEGGFWRCKLCMRLFYVCSCSPAEEVKEELETWATGSAGEYRSW